MAIDSFLHFCLEDLEPLDLQESNTPSSSSNIKDTDTYQKIINELNPLRYQEFPDSSRVKIVHISDIKRNCNNSIRQSFIAGMLPS